MIFRCEEDRTVQFYLDSIYGAVERSNTTRGLSTYTRKKISLRFTYTDAIGRHAVGRAVSRVPMFTHEAIYGGIAEVGKVPLTVSYREGQRVMKELYPMSTRMAMRR